MIKRLFAISVFLALACTGQAQTWTPLGPAGGDVHSLAADPSRPGRLFLGATDGHIFGSQDSGEHWTLLGRIGSRQDGVITSIVIDPRNADILFASTWTLDTASGGGVFRSDDGGRTWRAAGLTGQSVRALVMAPSDPGLLVAGTLDGVYRSHDEGASWERISPAQDEELRNLDSLAIDPRDPQTIYAGTFHLPWKTTDGGRTWRPIHDGMIDDSDVMSFLIDRENPARVYSSACSGIYRSDDGASQWQKIQGIPYTARRTYVIAQDPAHPSVVYAATSEGLWKTSDSGMTWRRTTPQDWAINTVAVVEGQPGRVVIGTDRLGVLASDDDGEHFHDANSGFLHRQVLAAAFDATHPGRVLVVLAHAPEAILVTDDAGKSWTPLGPGLRPEAILRVYASPDGWWASLAQGGLARYDAQKRAWQRAGTLSDDAAGSGTQPARSSRAAPRSKKAVVHGKPRQLDLAVNDLAFSSGRWLAATGNGLLVSTDEGVNWVLQPLGPLRALPVQSVRVSPDGKHIWLVSLRGLAYSADGGASWNWRDLPVQAVGAASLAVDPADGTILLAIARSGLYLSRDEGDTWLQPGAGLPSTPVQALDISGHVFTASMRTGGLYVSSDSGRTWTRLSGPLADGYFQAAASQGGGVIYAASATDGLYEVKWHASPATVLPATNEPVR